MTIMMIDTISYVTGGHCAFAFCFCFGTRAYLGNAQRDGGWRGDLHLSDEQRFVMGYLPSLPSSGTIYFLFFLFFYLLRYVLDMFCAVYPYFCY